ncbi:MAG: RluA family pseudouridine synthase [Nitrospirota bacterium]
MTIQEMVVQISEAGERLDVFLAARTAITRSQIQKIIEKGHVSVNGRQTARNYRIRAGDTIAIELPVKSNEGLEPEPIPVDILYADEYLVVVNKPAGMVMYPAAGHNQGTLMNAIAYHCPNLASAGGPLRPGVVHRLDKDTSGVIVIALDDNAYYGLVEQFRRRTVGRRYIALVSGALSEEQGEISRRIGRSGSDRKKMSTHARRGKEAVTKWKVLRRLGSVTLIEVKLGTGRTHQIRVHFASIGHPVLGDRTYGKKVEAERGKGAAKITFPRQMLHAAILGFVHPATGKYLEFSSPVPDDMKQKIEELSSFQ